jgi:hypothetical protein
MSGSLRHPQVLCIITQHLWVTVYFKARYRVLFASSNGTAATSLCEL